MDEVHALDAPHLSVRAGLAAHHDSPVCRRVRKVYADALLVQNPGSDQLPCKRQMHPESLEGCRLETRCPRHGAVCTQSVGAHRSDRERAYRYNNDGVLTRRLAVRIEKEKTCRKLDFSGRLGRDQIRHRSCLTGMDLVAGKTGTLFSGAVRSAPLSVCGNGRRYGLDGTVALVFHTGPRSDRSPADKKNAADTERRAVFRFIAALRPVSVRGRLLRLGA